MKYTRWCQNDFNVHAQVAAMCLLARCASFRICGGRRAIERVSPGARDRGNIRVRFADKLA